MERRKFVIGLGALAAGSGAAVGSGAFSAAQIRDRDVDIAVNNDAEALLQLEPGDSDPVEERVFYENGELAISFDGDTGNGVNPNSTYQVGAIDDTMVDAYESYAEDQADILAPGDVLYGQGGEVGDETGADDPAFTITNADTIDHGVELFYDGETPDNAEAAFVASGDDRGAAVFPVDGTDQDPDRLGAFPLGAGETLYVSLIVKTEDLNMGGEVLAEGDTVPDGGQDDFDGELVINAGEIVDQNSFDVTDPVDEDPED